MTLETVHWRGHLVVSASGPVERGDAGRLVSALSEVKSLAHGAKVVLLDSPGGSVAAAFAISETIDALETPIHMLVPNGARCSSACASIILISGDYRTVEPGGSVGQHSCSIRGVIDQTCNEDLAMHAVSHGVSHGSVAAFVTQVPPDEILWFTAEDLDCWGILRYPFGDTSGFEKSEPCFSQMIFGEYPQAQSAWRIVFYEDGFRAFVRTWRDHSRVGEVSLFCDERSPGQLFLAMDLSAPSTALQSAIQEVVVISEPVVLRGIPYTITEIENGNTRLVVSLGSSNTLPFLTKSNQIRFIVDLIAPYEPIVLSTYISNSRSALIFAANNCINK